ncbi:putative mannan endo-1,4-beta-mannosidase A-1 [Talaromyces proteolyticus]|uniref:mannan endo-1,4-beta-mannosidase n=1 Tax=Talaromyces proteolyticus TaxID=1131652 RepID=A0AAD4KK07_9EURO|nr:putative mannan endo-1,4-beta-mannosidase A-1 [Talaromyces proteolyticus]KAH8690034.1 putative mannan endo-1,4-beta-mannosidase A-1 [Talaromyces proteolyticus]
MKISTLLAIPSLAFLTLSQPTILRTQLRSVPSIRSQSQIAESNGSHASTSGTSFVIGGKKGYYAGTNSYWISFLTNNDDVDLVMGHLQTSGLKVLRVWGFNDVNTKPAKGTVWFQLLQNGKATINTGADGLQRLDYVVKSAEAHGIKLIINFVNNWSDYGGMPAYVKNYGGTQTGWYTNTAAQAAYQHYIKTVVSRYTRSSAIFAWELANEPRCSGCHTSVITNWVKKTSKFIKSLDSTHMVAIGSEGMGLATDSDGSYPFGYSEGNDFEATLAISTVDFGTIHMYPDQWSESDSWGTTWIQAHGKACSKAGKPCLLEEYGSSSFCSVEQPWQSAARTSLAGDLFWQWGDQLSTGKSPNDEYSVWYKSSDYTCLVTDHISQIGS